LEIKAMTVKLAVREELRPTPVYPVGTVLKLSKEIQKLRELKVKYVKVYPELVGCIGCIFRETSCHKYLNVACSAQERKGDRFPSIIFSPCDSEGRDLCNASGETYASLREGLK
jgi:hypothetical protein